MQSAYKRLKVECRCTWKISSLAYPWSYAQTLPNYSISLNFKWSWRVGQLYGNDIYIAHITKVQRHFHGLIFKSCGNSSQAAIFILMVGGVGVRTPWKYNSTNGIKVTQGKRLMHIGLFLVTKNLKKSSKNILDSRVARFLTKVEPA